MDKIFISERSLRPLGGRGWEVGRTGDQAPAEMAGAEDVSALPTSPHPEHLERPPARLPAASAGVSLPEGLLLSLLCYDPATHTTGQKR